MKIAVPLAKGRVADLTEDCEQFTIVHADLTENRILDSCREEPGAGWRGRLVPWLAEQTVDLVIAVDVEPKIKTDLLASNIRIATEAPNESPHVVIKAYLAGDLDQPGS